MARLTYIHIIKIILVSGILTVGSSNIFAQCLSGLYTVGGSSPDYADWQAAVDDLELEGVCGNVIFDVRTGTYYEKIIIPEISGASSSSTITFRSEVGNRDSVIIKGYGFSSTNYTIQLDGTDYIRFQDLTVNYSNSDYPGLVECVNTTQNNEFENVRFNGRSGNDEDYNVFKYVSPGTYENNIFDGCWFDGGHKGIYAYGGTSASNLVIANTLFERFRDYIVNLYSIENITVDDCIVNGIDGSSYGAMEGFRFNNSSGIVTFTDNQVNVYRESLLYVDGSPAVDSIYMVNNFFSNDYWDGSPARVRLQEINSGLIAFNTIKTPSSAFELSYSSNIDILNNIFASSGFSSTYYSIIMDSNSGLNSDYNCFYSGGGLDYESTIYSDLASYQFASGLDANSLAHDPFIPGEPFMFSTGDLVVNNEGVDLGGIWYDIQGELRSTTPDIGADEFSPVPIEAGVVNDYYNGFSACPGNQSLDIEIVNLGLNEITSIEFGILLDDVPVDTVIWTGSIMSADTLLIDGGIITVMLEQATTVDIKAEILTVNGVVDAFSSNNEFVLNDANVGVSGVYYIGGLYPDYESLTAAADDITEYGMCGNVTLLIRDGEYDGFSYFNAPSQSSPNDTLLVKSENEDSSLVTLTNDAFVVKFKNLDNIIIQDITFEKSGTTNENLVVASEFKNFRISNCILKSYNTPAFSSSDPVNSAIYGGALVIDEGSDAVVENCIITEADCGIACEELNDITIRNNKMFGFNCGAAVFHDCDTILVENNTMKATVADLYNFLSGFWLDNCHEEITISSNVIEVHNGDGFVVENSYPTGTNAKIYNNSVIVTQGSGVLANDISDWDFTHNSFNVYFDSESEVNDILTITSGDNFDFQNNLFSNNSTGAILSEIPTASNFDYNNLYFPGGEVTPSVISFSAWQGLGYDGSSFNLDPAFISDSNLFILSSPTLASGGIYFPSIATDLNSKWRTDPPSIGAYRIGTDTCDLELISIDYPQDCDSTVGLWCSFANFGDDTLNNAEIFFQINDSLDSYLWEGVLGTNDSVLLLQLSDVLFYHDSLYDLSVWIETLNNQVDDDDTNDSLAISFTGPKFAGTFEISGPDADFSTLAEGVEALKISGMCGDIIFNIRNSLQEDEAHITNIEGLGTYNLTIQSETGVVDSVVLEKEIYIEDASNITVRNMSFDDSPDSWSSGDVRLEGTCSEIIIEGNSMYGSTIGSVHFTAYGIYDNIQIKNNKLWEGAGIGASDWTALKTNILVEGNEFLQILMGMANGTDITVVGNYTSPSSFSGNVLNLTGCSGTFNIEKNDFLDLGIDFGIASGTTMNIENNILGRINGGGYDTLRFLHNTFYWGTDPETTGCSYGENLINVDAYDQISCYNNIYYVRPCCMIYQLDTAGIIFESDYNVFNVHDNLTYPEDESTEIINPGSGPDLNLADWQSASGLDLNSVWASPNFLGDGNYRLNPDDTDPSSTTYIIPSITEDIDNETRGVTSRTIGADETNLYDDNASIKEVLNPVECGSMKDIWVSLYNSGANDLTSAEILWEANEVPQTTFSWTGLISSGDTLDVMIGTYDMASDNSVLIKSWSELPNGVPDPFTIYDTSSTNILLQYSGNYTVYGASPDFVDLQEAIDSLSYFGICDTVYLNIRAGSHDLGTWGPTINAIPGSSDSAWLFIQSEDLDSSAATIYANYYSLTFEESNFVEVRQLTLESTSGSGGCVLIKNQCHDINISNNRLDFYSNVSGNAGIMVGEWVEDYPQANQQDNIIIRNNELHGAEDCIRLEGLSDPEAPETGENIQIKDNIIYNTNISGISTGGTAILGFGKIRKVRVEHNQVLSTTSEWDWDGIELYTLTGSDTCIIESNTVRLHRSRGIYTQASDGLYQIYNNEVSIAAFPPAYIIGIQGFVVNGFENNKAEVYNNSVLIDSTYDASIAIFISCDSAIVKNNHAVNMGDGVAIGINSTLESDHNVLYSNGPYIGEYYEMDIPDLITAKSLFGLDSNSVVGDPVFLNDTNLISTSGIGTDLGQTIEFVMDDIMDVPRSFLYDIGAYELDDFGNNLKLLDITIVPTYCHDSVEVHIDFENTGLNDVTSFDIDFTSSISGLVSTSWSGSLVPSESEYGYYLTTLPGDILPFTATVTLSNLNFGVVENEMDNELTISYDYDLSVPVEDVMIAICSDESVTIGGIPVSTPGTYIDTLTDIMGCDSLIQSITLAVTVKPDAGISFSDPTFTGSPVGMEYSWIDCADSSIIFSENSIDFTPSDYGSYAIIVNNGGCIDTSECLQNWMTGIGESGSEMLKLYPNPTKGEIHISSENQRLFEVYNPVGQLIFELKSPSKEENIDLTFAEAGVYFFVSTDSEGMRNVIKIVVE